MSVYSAPITVVAAQMADAITAELALASNVDRSVVLYDNKYTGYDAPDYSVKQNADAVIAGSATDAEKAAAKAMLNYGTHAQYYFLSDDGGDFAEAPLFSNAALEDADRLTRARLRISGRRLLRRYADTTVTIDGVQQELKAHKTVIITLKLPMCERSIWIVLTRL